MSKKTAGLKFTRWLFLLDEILKNKKFGISIESLIEKWPKHSLNDTKENYSTRSFYRDVTKIKELFGVYIEKKKLAKDEHGNSVYTIYDDGPLHNNNHMKRFMNLLPLFEMVNGAHRLAHRIRLESFHSDPLLLPIIFEAMDNMVCINVVYHAFDNDDPITHLVDPYDLMEYQHRFYILGVNKKYETLTTFALDRIVSLELTGIKSQYPEDFDIESYLYPLYSIFDFGVKPTRIILRAFGNEAKYLMTKPMHRTQQIIGEFDPKAEFTDFSYYFAPTKEFFGYIASRVDRLVVISPDDVRDKIIENHILALKRYMDHPDSIGDLSTAVQNFKNGRVSFYETK